MYIGTYVNVSNRLNVYRVGTYVETRKYIIVIPAISKEYIFTKQYRSDCFSTMGTYFCLKTDLQIIVIHPYTILIYERKSHILITIM